MPALLAAAKSDKHHAADSDLIQVPVFGDTELGTDYAVVSAHLVESKETNDFVGCVWL